MEDAGENPKTSTSSEGPGEFMHRLHRRLLDAIERRTAAADDDNVDIEAQRIRDVGVK